MAAVYTTSLEPSDEKTNGTRYFRLLVDGGTTTLCNYFRQKCTWPAVLSTHNATLLDLKDKRKVLREDQWNQLYPSSGSVDPSEFDITLLFLLLRNVCNLTAPATGWVNMPPDSDTSKEAHIVRIKCLRNEACHNYKTGIPNTEFNNKWVKLSTSLKALGCDPKKIDALKNGSIDHDTQARLEAQEAAWEKWKDHDQRIESLEKRVESVEHSLRDRPSTKIESRIPPDVKAIVGRDVFTEEVFEKVTEGDCQVVLITGGPGVGKTTLAIRVCHRLAERLSVFYCSLRYKNNITDVAEVIASFVSNNPAENAQGLLRNWARQLNQKVIFVLDNADDVLNLDDQHKQFLALLGDLLTISNNSITFVITSRESFASTDQIQNLEEIKVTVLEEEDAEKVLLSQLDTQKTKITRTTEIVRLCGCLPLALRIIGSLLPYYHSEDNLIAELEGDPLEVLESVKKAIQISFDFLSEDQKEYLVCMSVFAGSFDSKAVQTVNDKGVSKAITNLQILKQRSLVEKLEDCRYELHPLIQSFAKQLKSEKYVELLKNAELLSCKYFISQLATIANNYWIKEECKQSLMRFIKDRSSYEFSLEKISQETLKPLVPNVSQICLYLEMCLPPQKYLKLLKDLRSILDLENEQGEYIKVSCLLAHEYRKIGEWKSYENYLEEAKSKHAVYVEQSKDKDVVVDSFFFNFYAYFLCSQKRQDESKKYVRKALKACEELPKLPRSAFIVQKGMSLLYIGRIEKRFYNKPEKAKAYLQQALQILKYNLDMHPLTALLCCSLAEFYLFETEQNLGSKEDVGKALDLYKQALEIMSTFNIEDKKEAIKAFTNLGICYQEQGKFGEAEESLETAHKIANRHLDLNHKWKVDIKIQKAYLFHVKGDKEAAKREKAKALEMCKILKLDDSLPLSRFLLDKIDY